MTSAADKKAPTAQVSEYTLAGTGHQDADPLGFANSNSNSDSESDSEQEEEPGRTSMIRTRHSHGANDNDSSDSESDEVMGESEGGSDGEDKDGKQIGEEGKDSDKDDDEDYFVGDMDDRSDQETHEKPSGKQPKNKALSEKEILRAQKKEKKSGVVYMSRVPPFMKPAKVRHLLEKYAEIGRIYLVEEDEKRRKWRLKSGGNRRKQFVEGWIEFRNKKYAKSVASMLNNTPMGGKKHGFYHDDLWNLKYLPKFKWRHLTEQLASEKAAREQKLQSEISQSRKELEEYMKNVEKAKMLSGMRAKKEAQAKRGLDVAPMREKSRHVWQRDVVLHSAEGHVQGTSRMGGDHGDERDGRRDGRSGDSKRRKTMASVLDQIF